jgi:uracil-DNA glycosylase
MNTLDLLLADIRQCKICADLPLGPNPIVQASPTSRVLIVGQAPGRITHGKGRPFDDPSGNRLRDWMGVTREQFYDASLFAIVPMGFCYPGKGQGGDLAPRPECAPAWRTRLLAQLPDIRLKLVIGQYAHDWHLPAVSRSSLAARIKASRGLVSDMVLLPHPSPRNLGWFKANPWFAEDVLPELKRRISDALR